MKIHRAEWKRFTTIGASMGLLISKCGAFVSELYWFNGKKRNYRYGPGGVTCKKCLGIKANKHGRLSAEMWEE